MCSCHGKTGLARVPVRRTLTIIFFTSLLLAASGYAMTRGERKHAPVAPAAVIATANAPVLQVTPVAVKTQPRWLSLSASTGADLFAFIKPKAETGKLNELSNFDRNLYLQIFTAQEQEQWSRANALIKRLHNRILVGHVLYQRYIVSKNYKSSYGELRHWMVQYGDHPDAYKVYQLAQKRRNNDPAALPAPQTAKNLLGALEWGWLNNHEKAHSRALKSVKRNEGDIRQLVNRVKQLCANQEVTKAYNLLGATPAAKTLTALEYDTLLSEIASAYYYSGKHDIALSLSAKAIKRSGKLLPMAYWTGGLAAWQKGDYKRAQNYFEALTNTTHGNAWTRSSGAFWAARAHEKLGDSDGADDWLHEAASYPRTFYGTLAQARLGDDFTFSWEAPPLTTSLLDALREKKSGQRALALLDLDQRNLAEAEFRQIHPDGNKRMEKALVAAAHYFKLPGLAMRIGNAVNQPDGSLYDVALYPVVPWKGDETTGVDPALVNALIRQESKFDPAAQNGRSGATGLMQLMPKTADFISDKPVSRNNLNDPETNIALGQRYVRYLLNLPQVDNNLVFMAAAYNAGPGKLARWQKESDYQDDPLLFIESLPSAETRGFIARVMTNYWIYTERLKQDTNSLEALGKNAWPIYHAAPSSLKLAAF